MTSVDKDYILDMSTCPALQSKSISWLSEIVDPKSPIPRYYQLYTSLRGRIREGEFQTGEALPSERQLVEDYGVSRITVVKALDILDQEGLIERQQGKGNFVTNRLIDMDEPERLKIAVFFPYVIQPSHLFDGILKGIGGREIQLQIVGFYNPVQEPWYVQDAIDRGFDGFIFYPARGFLNKGMYRDLIEQEISVCDGGSPSPATRIGLYYF